MTEEEIRKKIAQEIRVLTASTALAPHIELTREIIAERIERGS